jgi:carbonic anhydrase
MSLLHDCAHHPSRRDFSLLLAGAGILAAMPFAARAAGDVDALCVTCIDFRLVASTAPFFDSMKLHGEYDQVSLAGASLAAVSPKFPSANAAFWDQLEIARNLHHVRRLVVLDHRDCGAFKVAFGKDFAPCCGAETAQHKSVMLQVQQELAKTQPGLPSEYYLMALDGTAERVL